MSHGNYGHPANQPKRGGSGIMFLVMLFVAGFFIMNVLRQQGSMVPGEGQLPDRSSERGDYFPNDESRSTDFEPSQAETESKSGIYGTGQAERPVRHPDAADWEMEEVSNNKSTAGANQSK